MKLVAVIGAHGFVGLQIAKAIEADKRYRLIPIYRNTHCPEQLIGLSDIIIHAANPAGRYQAENQSQKDFIETVEKTANLFTLSKDKRFVLISSMSCRTQLDTAYGRHRRACELLVLPGNSLVIRLGPMFGGGRKKDMLHDILAGQEVYIGATSRYAYVDVEWAGKTIVNMIEGKSGIKEIGAYNSICLQDLAHFFESKSKFSGVEENQIPEDYLDGPNANDVYDYVKGEIWKD